MPYENENLNSWGTSLLLALTANKVVVKYMGLEPKQALIFRIPEVILSRNRTGKILLCKHLESTPFSNKKVKYSKYRPVWMKSE